MSTKVALQHCTISLQTLCHGLADLSGHPKMDAGGGILCLRFLEAGVLFNEFLLAVPGKTDGQLDLVA